MSESGMIDISVATQYVEDQSQPDSDRYVFAYTITITNNGASPSQLLRRHWVITDAVGETEEVRGEGVIGKQPRLRPGESFQYTSGAILRTPVGAMHGEYEFEDEQGRLFDVPIPPFSLSLPNMVH